MIRKRLQYIFKNYRKKVTLAEYVYEINYNPKRRTVYSSDNIPRSVFNRIRIQDKGKNVIVGEDYYKFKRKRRVEQSRKWILVPAPGEKPSPR